MKWIAITYDAHTEAARIPLRAYLAELGGKHLEQSVYEVPAGRFDYHKLVKALVFQRQLRGLKSVYVHNGEGPARNALIDAFKWNAKLNQALLTLFPNWPRAERRTAA